MNKKLIAFFSILSLLLSTPLIPANAAAKAGAKCAKAGNTEVVKGKSYTCVKSGKKLVWNKGATTSKSVDQFVDQVPPLIYINCPMLNLFDILKIFQNNIGF